MRRNRMPADSGKRLLSLLTANKDRGEWRIANEASGQVDIYLYNEIGFWGVSADDFSRVVVGLDTKKIVLHLNSPGGDAWDGQAIYHVLKDHPAEVEVRVEGVAASAASTIAMAGDHVVMAPHAMMMIHDAWMLTAGDARDHQKSVEILDKLSDSIAGFYADHAGGEAATWRAHMLAETWYTDREAVDAALADEVAGDEAESNRFDLSAFLNTPAPLLQPAARAERQLSKREVEQALREAGMPAAAAKAIIASGWDGLGDDAREERAREQLLNLIQSA